MADRFPHRDICSLTKCLEIEDIIAGVKSTQSMFETALSPFLPFLPVLAKPDVVTTDF